MIHRPLVEIFPFFGNAKNLELITPPWLQFRILTPDPIVMREGVVIDYRITFRGIPLRWRTLIEKWDPPYRFIDVQIKGPYRLWHHEHLFEPSGHETVCQDRVRYAAPGSSWVEHLFVRPAVDEIFAFRSKKLLELFPATSTPEPGDQFQVNLAS
ncbi:MAG: SRPBCC family protein [Verrucomicrobia bacterium]|nr:SRPBCC family protein [Verrucomicrobiota bacterium]